jgi:Kdo2-lipid IVA lauroyltransferase/acyltransferase
MFNNVVYLLFISVTGAFRLLPRGVQVSAFECLLRFVVWLKPKYKRIAHKNLLLAFPDMALDGRRLLLKKHLRALATLVIDFLNIEKVSPEWAKEHVVIDASDADLAFIREGGGMMFVSAHFGSFELTPTVFKHVIQRRLNFVVRPLKQPQIDRWWNAKREFWGSKTVARDGAIRAMLKALRDNECIGLLFDQNVREAHGMFVEWFGRLACTTRAVGMLAVKTRVPVFVTNVAYKPGIVDGKPRLQFLLKRIPIEDVVSDEDKSVEEREVEVTRRCVHEIERIIRAQPEDWFWLHRRWKTAPQGSGLDGFYERESLRGVEI